MATRFITTNRTHSEWRKTCNSPLDCEYMYNCLEWRCLHLRLRTALCTPRKHMQNGLCFQVRLLYESVHCSYVSYAFRVYRPRLAQCYSVGAVRVGAVLYKASACFGKQLVAICEHTTRADHIREHARAGLGEHTPGESRNKDSAC